MANTSDEELKKKFNEIVEGSVKRLHMISESVVLGHKAIHILSTTDDVKAFAQRAAQSFRDELKRIDAALNERIEQTIREHAIAVAKQKEKEKAASGKQQDK